MESKQQSNFKIYTTTKSIILHNVLSNKLLIFENFQTTEKNVYFLSSITINKTLDAVAILGVINILGYEFLVVIEKSYYVGSILEAQIYRVEKVSFIQMQTNEINESEKKDYITNLQDGIMAYIMSGFYYSDTYNLTDNFQRNKKQGFVDYNDKYFWNKALIMNCIKGINENPIEFIKKWFVVVICGYIDIGTHLVNNADEFKLILISRRNKNYAGTRYLTRGIDEDANCGNFVETEQIFIFKNNLFAYTQIRGSVPVFYSQIPPLYLSTEILRDIEISIFHYKKHISDLLNQYGDVSLVNLLGNKEYEKLVSTTYENHYNYCENLKQKCDYFYYDFHSKCKNDNFGNIKELLDQLFTNLNSYSFFQYNIINNVIIKEQKGVFRTNCMDCLDRTNVIQSRIAHLSLKIQLKTILSLDEKELIQITENDYDIKKNKIMKMFKHMWADNGDILSIQYCGTASNITSVTKHGSRGFWGYITGAKTSLDRFIIGNISDELKQKCIDCLLQKYSFERKEEDFLKEEELKIYNESFKTSELIINICNWNISAIDTKNFTSDLLSKFILPNKDINPDIYVVGMQRIVDLNAKTVIFSNYQNENTSNYIETLIYKEISKLNNYILVKRLNLVGLFLLIYIKDTYKERIKNIQYRIEKLGMQKTLGNKGNLIVRFELDDTSFSFSCSHFKNEYKNTFDRYEEIFNILRSKFTNDKWERKFSDNDFYFILGDLNFITHLDRTEIMKYLDVRDYQSILQFDEFIQQKNGVFKEKISEAKITFPPTFKYKKNNNVFSKSRNPSWADRILYKENFNIEVINYNTIDCIISQHKPVYGIFKVKVKKFLHEKFVKLTNKYKINN